MSRELPAICGHCNEPLYECPLCLETYHRPNVLLGEFTVVCCLPCYFARNVTAIEPWNLRALFERQRRYRRGDTYDGERELACA